MSRENNGKRRKYGKGIELFKTKFGNEIIVADKDLEEEGPTHFKNKKSKLSE